MATARQKCARCCRSFAAYLFSTIGLVLVLAAYSSLGGSLFLWLERDSEVADLREARRIMATTRRAHAEALWSITERLNVLYKANWTHEAERVLKEFEKLTYVQARTTKWDGQSPEDPVSPKWTFAGALFYAITAITTIGYGHVTPVTKEGQICTMIYALIGIPLTIMCTLNVGKFFANLFRFTYHAVCCGLCCLCRSGKRKLIVQSHRDRESGHLKKQDIVRNDLDKSGSCAQVVERQQRAMGSAASPTTTATPLSVIRSDSSVGRRQEAHPAFGGGRQECNGEASRPVAQATPKGGHANERIRGAATASVSRLLRCRQKIRKALKEQAPVPAYLCLVIMGAYITGGALIFSLWENWDYVSGAYFCFVTLTTIGFGDLVPGVIVGLSDTADWDSTSKLLLCALYLFFGLSLVAMCFDLMREDVTMKLVYIGKKIGLLKDNRAETSDA